MAGSGLDWCTSAVKECIEELVELSTGERATSAADQSDLRFADTIEKPPIEVTNKSADSLDHLADGPLTPS